MSTSPCTEPTLTVQNLTNVMKSVRDVTQWFDIPHSKLREIKMNHPNVTDFRQELFRYYINHRPGASWLQMADTAWVFNEDAVLDMINRSYLKGNTCSNLYGIYCYSSDNVFIIVQVDQVYTVW